MITHPERDVQKAVAFHLVPLGLVFLISLAAIYSLLNHLRPQAGAKQYLDDTPPTTQLSSMPFHSASLSTIFTEEILHWTSDIARWAADYNLDPNLIAIVMQIESCGHPKVVSFAGALGLFQVMPFHFVEDENPFDPDINAHRGLRYLARALELAQGDISLAMAGYNGGHSIIEWSSMLWSQETKRYVYWASGIYADIKKGADESPRLGEWLAAGGSSLCSRASYALNS